MRRIVASLCLGILTTAMSGLGPPTINAASKGGVTADLDGRPIRASEAGSYFCHDFEYPRIHCFSDAASLEAALTVPGAGTMSLAVAATDYITVYSEPMYGGSYAHLAQNYDGLWTIGWNDRISSFKVRNNATGRFYQDWYSGGWRYNFCCNSQVPGLSSTYDNQFSSAYRG